MMETMAAVAAAGLDSTLADQRVMAAARRYFTWQARLVQPYLGRRILEAGCGIGNFTAVLRRQLAPGARLLATDRDPACLELWRRRHGNLAELAAVRADLADDSFLSLRDWGADTCLCLNVLEHISDDGAALARLAAVVAAGGRIVAIVPASAALYGPIDRALGHYRRYSRRRLAALAAALELRPVCLRYWNCAGFFGWWWNARVAGRTAQSPVQVAIFDSAVPALAAAEAMAGVLFAPPFGQSLLAVWEKPA